MKRALVTGITGQDGSYLAELLCSKGYEVHGVIRRASTFNTQRIDQIYQDPHDPHARLFLHYGDLSSTEWLVDLIYSLRPDEVYHLAAQSHVKVSFEIPEYTSDVTALGALRVLDAIRRSGVKVRFYQASSSEMFGVAAAPQNENTPFCPRSPYAVSKLFAYWTARIYREGHGVFASNGILFNHESPRRGETFLTRKVTRAVGQIAAGSQKKLFLGNLEAKRDWGYAPEYVEAMFLILQHSKPDDFVVGTGEAHSVKEFAAEAFGYAGLDWNKYVQVDPRYLRPLEVEGLVANASKARKELGWEPKVTFQELVAIMVDADLELAGIEPPGKGKAALKAKFSGWHHWQNPVVSVIRATGHGAGDSGLGWT